MTSITAHIQKQRALKIRRLFTTTLDNATKETRADKIIRVKGERAKLRAEILAHVENRAQVIKTKNVYVSR